MTHWEPGSVQFQAPVGVEGSVIAWQASKTTGRQLYQVMLRPEPSFRRKAP